MQIRASEASDRGALEAFLARWHSARVARRGELLRPLDHPALIAEESGRLVAALTYVLHGRDCEILTLHADERRRGVGSALIAEVTRIAREAGCTRLWVLTTNDNVDALRFYQRRGFRLAALRPGAVEASRRSPRSATTASRSATRSSSSRICDPAPKSWPASQTVR
jgi:ribosomal protein S18 acetylase RimI-like enzyme